MSENPRPMRPIVELPPALYKNRWKPGQSGNPGGRKKGLERRVRELIGKDLDDMVLAMRDIVLGLKPAEGSPLRGEKITARDRIEAFKVLTDRGWGKARAIVPINEASPGDDLTLLTSAELDQLIQDAEADEDDDEDNEDAVEPGAEADADASSAADR